MRLSLKTRFTLAFSLLVLAVVTVVSSLYIVRLTRQTLRQANDRAQFVAQQVYEACRNALDEAAERGDTPASRRSGGRARVRARGAGQQQHPQFPDRIGPGNTRRRFTKSRSAIATVSFWYRATHRCAVRRFRRGQA